MSELDDDNVDADMDKVRGEDYSASFPKLIEQLKNGENIEYNFQEVIRLFQSVPLDDLPDFVSDELVIIISKYLNSVCDIYTKAVALNLYTICSRYDKISSEEIEEGCDDEDGDDEDGDDEDGDDEDGDDEDGDDEDGDDVDSDGNTNNNDNKRVAVMIKLASIEGICKGFMCKFQSKQLDSETVMHLLTSFVSILEVDESKDIIFQQIIMQQLGEILLNTLENLMQVHEASESIIFPVVRIMKKLNCGQNLNLNFFFLSSITIMKGLLSTMKNYCQKLDDDGIAILASSILADLTFISGTNDCKKKVEAMRLLYRPELAFFSTLAELLNNPQCHSYVRGDIFHILINSGFNTCDSDVLPIFESNIHITLLTILQQSVYVSSEIDGKPTLRKAEEWPKHTGDILVALMVFGRHFAGVNLLVLANAVPIVCPIVEVEGVHGITALLLSAFLIGRNEKKSSFQVSEESMRYILFMLQNALNKELCPDYFYGDFELCVLISGCLALSTNDANKQFLNRSNLLSMLQSVLELYVSNSPGLVIENEEDEETAGGGGDDAESASLAVETLLQLSFFYESDEEMRKYFVSDIEALVQLLHGACAVVEPRLGLTKSAFVSAQRLINRLTEPIVQSPGAEGISVSTPRQVQKLQHIMLSYCWNSSAMPEHVRTFGQELRQLGYEVWRDEDGSQLVKSMSGSTDDRMAEAIEHSHTIVVCVSEAYKNSANCRMEGQYANNRKKRGLVNIVYVMMNEHYTTVSSPLYCDGWLGIMIGDSLWYPMWTETQISATVKAIAAIIGTNARSEDIARSIEPYITDFKGSGKKLVSAKIEESPSRLVPSTSVSLPNIQLGPPMNNGTHTYVHNLGFTPEAHGILSQFLALIPTSIMAQQSVPSSSINVMGDRLTLWSLLTHPSKSLDRAQLTSLLENLGVTSDYEIQCCDNTQIALIADLLKPVPRAAFFRLLAENSESTHGSTHSDAAFEYVKQLIEPLQSSIDNLNNKVNYIAAVQKSAGSSPVGAASRRVASGTAMTDSQKKREQSLSNTGLLSTSVRQRAAAGVQIVSLGDNSKDIRTRLGNI